MTDTCEFCGKPDGTTGGSLTVVNEGDCDCADWALAHARQIGHLRRKYVEARRAHEVAEAEFHEAWLRDPATASTRLDAAAMQAALARGALLALFAEEP